MYKYGEQYYGSMKVCPKCGYIDRSHWRQNRWRTNVEFLPIDEFNSLYPNLLEELQKGHLIVTDKLHAYRTSGSSLKVVERVLRCDYEVGGKTAFHIPRERHKPMDPFQRKLE